MSVRSEDRVVRHVKEHTVTRILKIWVQCQTSGKPSLPVGDTWLAVDRWEDVCGCIPTPGQPGHRHWLNAE